MIEALLGFGAIFALALLRVPLAFSMGLVGIVGIGVTRGWMPASITITWVPARRLRTMADPDKPRWPAT